MFLSPTLPSPLRIHVDLWHPFFESERMKSYERSVYIQTPLLVVVFTLTLLGENKPPHHFPKEDSQLALSFHHNDKKKYRRWVPLRETRKVVEVPRVFSPGFVCFKREREKEHNGKEKTGDCEKCWVPSPCESPLYERMNRCTPFGELQRKYWTLLF